LLSGGNKGSGRCIEVIQYKREHTEK
jgi:hypothetical protein